MSANSMSDYDIWVTSDPRDTEEILCQMCNKNDATESILLDNNENWNICDACKFAIERHQYE